MIGLYLKDIATSIAIRALSHFQEQAESKMLTVTDVASYYGHFKSDTYSNETATLLSPSTSGSLRITDLIISSEKQTGGVATIQFYDGTNTVKVVSLAADSPIQLASNFKGRCTGWKDAYIQVIISAAFNTTVSVWYVKINPKETLGFDAWDALR